MKKKLIALFSACSMITTAVAGLVQTAYADAKPNVRIEVSDGATDTQKVLTFYYEGFEALNNLQGKLTFTGGIVTIDSATITIQSKYTGADKDSGIFYFAEEADGGASSSNGSFAIATITVPGDVDITANFEVQGFEDPEFEEHKQEIGTVSVTIPKKSAPIPAITPAAVTAVEKQNTDAITGTGEYESQTADIYGVEITPNDESVSGATVSVGEKTKDINFKTIYSGEGTVVFAVILASETGAALPALSADNVTPIVVAVD